MTTLGSYGDLPYDAARYNNDDAASKAPISLHSKGRLEDADNLRHDDPNIGQISAERGKRMSNDTALLAESDHSGFEDALPSAENSIGGGAAPGTWKASEGMLSDLKKEEGTAPSCSQGRGSAASILEDHDDVIWENLEDIFADMDAGKDAKQDNRAVLREPLAQLRSLLALYNKIKERESRMASAHMGVLLERSWYHNKLCAIEVGGLPVGVHADNLLRGCMRTTARVLLVPSALQQSVCDAGGWATQPTHAALFAFL
eukprot:jgi/Mesvir1/24370/Mv11042-RA.2